VKENGLRLIDYYCRNFQEGLRRTLKRQDNRCRGRDSKRGPTENKIDRLQLELLCSVSGNVTLGT
jgi:hypothetical protein